MSNQFMGQSMRRVDGRLKVTGSARYTADQEPAGLVYAYGVFSTVASGRILKVDSADARRIPGVLEIFSHEHFARLYSAPRVPFSLDTILTGVTTDEHRLPFEDATVHYAGQFVAVVVADTFEHAREAAYKVKVQYATHKAIANLEQGMAAGKPKAGQQNHRRGDADAAFATSTNRIDEIYRTPVETHNPMEMHATVAQWRGDHLHVFEASQAVTIHRNTLATIFGLTNDQVTVEAPFIGSGFGSKLWIWPHSIAASAVARHVGRPVKLVVPRAQMFTTTGHRPETQQRVRIAADAQGKLTALLHESINTTSFIDQYVETCGTVSRSLYSCPDVTIDHKTIEVNRGAPTSMRAPGAAPGLFALESAIDELALATNQDPLSFRIRNISTRDESENLPWSSNHLHEAMIRGAEQFGWAKRNPAIGSMREGTEIIGYGMAACNWDAFRTPSLARVQLRSDGVVVVSCANQDIGTGTYTIIAQTAAELTGVPLERIEVRLGDSDFPSSTPSGGSWVTASVLPAVADATRKAIDQLKGFATADGAVFSGAKTEALRMEHGRLTDGKRSVDYQAILKAQRYANASGEGDTGGAPKGEFSFRSFGVHFVEVRWDPGISRLRVARVVSAIDVGRVINPLTAKNQVEGAIVMGIGMAMFEGTEFDPRTGLPANNNYAEYVVPVHADLPEIDVLLLDYPDYKLNEFGARGIGEIGTTGLAAAVANAVYHASGKRVRELPITLDKLMSF